MSDEKQVDPTRAKRGELWTHEFEIWDDTACKGNHCTFSRWRMMAYQYISDRLSEEEAVTRWRTVTQLELSMEYEQGTTVEQFARKVMERPVDTDEAAPNDDDEFENGPPAARLHLNK